MINTDMLDPNALVRVDQKKVDHLRPSPISMMPEGLLNTLTYDELLDLLAYLLSQGNRHHAMFQEL